MAFRRTVLLSVGMSIGGLLLTLAPRLSIVIAGLAIFSSGVFVSQSAATVLTGRVPLVFEPERPADTGGWGGGCGYGVVGGWGSVLLPAQVFVTAFRPTGTGVPIVAGYGIPTGAYATAGQAEYAAMAMIQGAVTDADIYAAVDATKPAGTTAWTSISS